MPRQVETCGGGVGRRKEIKSESERESIELANEMEEKSF